MDELVVGLLHKARGEEICFHLHVGDTLPYGHEGNGLKVGTFMAAHIDEGTGTPICTVAVGGEGGSHPPRIVALQNEGVGNGSPARG